MTLLDLRALSKEFDGLRALDGVSFTAEGGEDHRSQRGR
jgi:ABC-type branched-subunit amino acid transport system ATPase component